MEERSNKTIMCSVFFLDIVGYSKKSVTGQISLKERFNSYLSAAIRDVPIEDRIILDTGDGAAISFLGDIEDALKAAVSLRESLLNEDTKIEHPLLVRMGINLGPVRLIRDINGQPNIVGDGINVAQRVMGFADVSQILVSRSYYDAVSRVSPKYAGMFHYQGSRTDKHVREHEVYAIGYPGDKTTLIRKAELYFNQTENPVGKALAQVYSVIRPVVIRMDDLKELLFTRFRRADPMQRVLYIGATVAPLLLLIVLLPKLGSRDEPAMPVYQAISAGNGVQEMDSIQPRSGVAGVSPQSGMTVVPASYVVASTIANNVDVVQNQAAASPVGRSIAGSNGTKDNLDPKRPKRQPKSKTHSADRSQSTVALPEGGSDAYLSIRCIEGAEVFLDGTRKGRLNGSPLTIKTLPGSHTVIVSHPQGVDSRNVVLEAGKIVHINPGFCK